MALFKYPNQFKQDQSTAFDQIHRPGQLTPYSGIYRCQGCGVEIVSEYNKPFPPTRSCPLHHPNGKSGTVTWRLVAFAEHKGN